MIFLSKLGFVDLRSDPESKMIQTFEKDIKRH